MRQIFGKRVFLASPGDVQAERATVRSAITKFNESFAWDAGTTFFWRGWEQTTSGVDRPQERINDETLVDCDYLVLILGARWGSRPQVGDGFESGTEEEFIRTLGLLADPSAPMRNMFIGFRGVTPDKVRDPQLERVLEFKDQLERSKGVLFKVFDSQEDLMESLSANLHMWAGQNGEKEVLRVELLPREPLVRDQRSTIDATEQALEMVQLKRFTQAEELFNMAIEKGDPTAKLEYARFLRRQGRLSTALQLSHEVIRSLIASRVDARNIVRAKALANIGIIQRQRGEPEQAVRTLSEALQEMADEPLESELRTYIHDTLAITYGRLGQPQEAAEQYRLSREFRERAGQSITPHDFVNEARAQLRLKDRDEALALIDQALALGGASIDLGLKANALDVRRRALYEKNDYAAAAEAARECLSVNQQLGNANGISIAEVGLALALISIQDVAGAEAAARASLNRSLNQGNPTGHASATWALAQVYWARNERNEALELAAQALSAANDARNTPLAGAISHWISQSNRATAD